MFAPYGLLTLTSASLLGCRLGDGKAPTAATDSVHVAVLLLHGKNPFHDPGGSKRYRHGPTRGQDTTGCSESTTCRLLTPPFDTSSFSMYFILHFVFYKSFNADKLTTYSIPDPNGNRSKTCQLNF